MKKTLDIALFNECFPPIEDGVSSVMKNYAYGLKRQGHEVCVVTPKVPHYEYPTDFPIYSYHSIPMFLRMPYRIGIPWLAFRTVKNYQQIPLDIVHAHSPFVAGHLGYRIAQEKNIPLVATFHSKFRDDYKRSVPFKWLVDWMVKETIAYFNLADEVWIPQASVEEVIRDYGFKKNVFVVPNGMDFKVDQFHLATQKVSNRKELSIDKNESVLLFVGQHIWEKNISFILKALAELKDVPFKMFFIGTGYAEKEIKQRVIEYGLSQKVVMVGAIHQREVLQKYFSIADLFLFPSLYDNAPLVVKEAAAHRVPSLMIKGSTASEVIVHESNGFLSDNSIKEYASLIKTLLSDRNTIEKVGFGAANTLGRHWDSIMPEVEERYRYLIEKKKGTKSR